MSKVVITIEGGLVQQVYSTDPDLQVVVLDLDIEGADDDEIMSLDELHSIMDNEKVKAIEYKSGVFDGGLFTIVNHEDSSDETGA